MRWVTLTVLNLPVEVLKLLTTETVTSSEEHIDLDAFAGLRANVNNGNIPANRSLTKRPFSTALSIAPSQKVVYVSGPTDGVLVRITRCGAKRRLASQLSSSIFIPACTDDSEIDSVSKAFDVILFQLMKALAYELQVQCRVEELP